MRCRCIYRMLHEHVHWASCARAAPRRTGIAYRSGVAWERDLSSKYHYGNRKYHSFFLMLIKVQEWCVELRSMGTQRGRTWDWSENAVRLTISLSTLCKGQEWKFCCTVSTLNSVCTHSYSSSYKDTLKCHYEDISFNQDTMHGPSYIEKCIKQLLTWRYLF